MNGWTKLRQRLSALALAWAITLAALAPAAQGAGGSAIVDGDQPFISGNITHVRNVPIAGAIGAVFRGSYMYVTGVEGLSTFNIATPDNPQLTSVVPLPHFENEDVSLGGNLLLIANDSAEGVGVLYVFDISRPATPALLAAFPTGGDIATDDRPSHTATCIQACRYAYLAGTGRGILIVDLTTPAAPRIAGEFKPPVTGWASHDVSVDSSGLVWVVGGAGTAAYNVTNPLKPRLVAISDNSSRTAPLNDFIHHNATRSFTRTPQGQKVAGRIVYVTEEDYARPTCENAGSFQTWRIRGELSAAQPAELKNLDSWTTELNELTQLEGKSPATILCSAHWFDVRGGFVIQAWYEQGTRLLDVRDPANIKQAGYFVMPLTETWAAHWAPTDPTGQIVYAIDLARGIDVLRVRQTAPDAPPKRAPIRASWLGDGSTVPAALFSQPSATFSWACRVPKLTD